MTRVLLRAAGLTVTYLLVMTSVAPGDVLVGAAIGLALALTVRPAGPTPRAAPLARLAVMLETGREMVVGSWRTVRFCLGAPGAPGLVEIPRGGRSRSSVAFWGVLTGEAPDEVVVDVDEERDVLIVHLVDASDPDAVRARHQATYERRQRKVVP